MGCTGEKEKLEDQMMMVKLKRMEIQMEKEKELKKLSEIEGKPIQRRIIPDYIDPIFAKENNLNEGDAFISDDKKTDIAGLKKNEKKEKKSKSKDTKKKLKKSNNKDKISDINNKEKKKVK